MTNVYVRRLDRRVPATARADVVIDLLDDTTISNIDHDLAEIFRRVGSPSAIAQDLLTTATSVFVADNVLLRDDADDAWTRDISISLPTGTPAAWESAQELLRTTLTFLSGDRWTFAWRREVAPMAWTTRQGNSDAGTVCLFSGGLDSLVGAINFLEQDPDRRLVLLGWYDTTQGGRTRRERLADELARTYGQERVTLVPIWLAPAPRRPHQKHPFGRDHERTSRSRSFLYISLAVAAATALSPTAQVIAPENGFIAINPPMTPARLGSLSTRTMHPYFLGHLRASLGAVGLTHPITNPLGYETKAEVLRNCANRRLLKRLFPLTVSCSRSGRGKEAGRTQDNCGYCYPCIVRRAAAATMGWDTPSDYRHDVLRDDTLFAENTTVGSDARAVFAGLRELSPARVIATGPIPSADLVRYIRLVERGAGELRAFFGAAKPSIRRIAML